MQPHAGDISHDRNNFGLNIDKLFQQGRADSGDEELVIGRLDAEEGFSRAVSRSISRPSSGLEKDGTSTYKKILGQKVALINIEMPGSRDPRKINGHRSRRFAQVMRSRKGFSVSYNAEIRALALVPVHG